MQQPISGHQRPPFTALPNWIGGQATALQIAVLFALAYHAPDIHPSHQRIAVVAGMSRRTVQRVLGELEARQWVRAIPRRDSTGAQEAHQYVLNISPADDGRLDPQPAPIEAHPPASERRTPLRQSDAPLRQSDAPPPCVRETHKQEKNLPYWFSSTFKDSRKPRNKCSSGETRPRTESAAGAASSRSIDRKEQSSQANSRSGALSAPLASVPVKPAQPAAGPTGHDQPERMGDVPPPPAARPVQARQQAAITASGDGSLAQPSQRPLPGLPGVMSDGGVRIPQRFAEHGHLITAWLRARFRLRRSAGAAMELTTADEEALDYAAAQGVLPAFLQDAERRGARSLAYQLKATVSRLQVDPAAAQAFSRFKAIYLAIPERALGQTITKARNEFAAALRRGFTGEQIIGALQRERSAQLANLRADRFAAPFPDMARWLRDGRFEAWIDPAAAAGTNQPPTAGALPAEPQQQDYPTAEAWHEAHRKWRIQRWGSGA
jgi:hypothetical protein